MLDEPEIVVNGSRYKPELVVKTNEGGVLVLDVTVRYERNNPISKWEPLKTNICKVSLQAVGKVKI